ncbi:MAG: YiiD C-terminal domain-containing protein [Myxococcales bacterium]
MALLNRLAEAIGTARFLKTLRVYPPYLGAGIALRSVERDLTAVEVEMKLRVFNQNFVGTHFGGSLYSMCDPWFMIMLIHQLGDGYVVWDKRATIDFLKPGRGTVRARFDLPREKVAELKAEVDEKGKINPTFETVITDAAGEPIAKVTKLLSIRRKDRRPE